MTYEEFARDFWREMKSMAVTPALSIGEVCGLLVFTAYPPPWWVSVPVVFAWIIWRNNRRDSDTRPKAGDAKQGSTRE
jgi:hypothetical protein